jgi:carbamate kinase
MTFVEAGGREGVIIDMVHLDDALAGHRGTRVRR